MNIVIYIIVAIIGIAAGVTGGYTVLYKHARVNTEKKKEKAAELLASTEKECAEIKEKAKAWAAETTQRVEEYIKTTETLLAQMETSLNNKELATGKQEEKANQLKLKLAGLEEEVSAREAQASQLEKTQISKLTAKSGKTEEDVKKEILNGYEKELVQENAQKLAMMVDQCKEKAQRLAQNVIISAIQRLCSPTSVEPRAIQVQVPRDIVKGRIVGKDAQNILYFEELIDVDVVFNDLPQTISISAFNLVNRRIAQKALENLVNEKGDIDKARILKAVTLSKQEVDKELFEIGKTMVDRIGLTNLDPELVRTIGRLQFRTSYSQNIMRHSMEVGYLATMMGSEIGLDIKVCKIAGFLHDLGKAIDQNPDVQGTHDFLTKELMEKYGFSKEEIHAAWTHHESEKPATPEALIVQAADALSASRPGARQESLEKYLERLRGLEDLAASFEGVKKSFAISAGREVRAIVDPTIVEDSKTTELAEKIAKRIEGELTYPGKIKVNVIRKTKTIEVAK